MDKNYVQALGKKNCGSHTLWKKNKQKRKGGRKVLESQGRLHRADDTGDRHKNIGGKSPGGEEKEV